MLTCICNLKWVKRHVVVEYSKLSIWKILIEADFFMLIIISSFMNLSHLEFEYLFRLLHNSTISLCSSNRKSKSTFKPQGIMVCRYSKLKYEFEKTGAQTCPLVWTFLTYKRKILACSLLFSTGKKHKKRHFFQFPFFLTSFQRRHSDWLLHPKKPLKSC